MTSEIKNQLKINTPSLNKGDKIFGIRLYLAEHSMVEPEELGGMVDIIDYCDVSYIGIDEPKNDLKISISHPSKSLDIRSSMWLDEYINEHCYLSVDLMKTGYNSFYTLKPEYWKEDLIRMMNKQIDYKKKNFLRDVNILEHKLDLFIKSEDIINNHI